MLANTGPQKARVWLNLGTVAVVVVVFLVVYNLADFWQALNWAIAVEFVSLAVALGLYVRESKRSFFKYMFLSVPEGDYQPPILPFLTDAGILVALFVGVSFSYLSGFWVAVWFCAGLLTYKVAWYEFVLHTDDYRGQNFAAARRLLSDEYRDKSWLRPARWIAAVGALTLLHVEAPLGFVLPAAVAVVVTVPIIGYLEWRLFIRFARRMWRGE